MVPLSTSEFRRRSRQAAPLNLQNQERRCREYCLKQGLSVLQVFVDPGESGRSIDRPAFQQMLTHCKANRRDVSVVVVQDLSRFARNLQDQATTIIELGKSGNLVRSVTESSIDEAQKENAGGHLRNI